MKIAIGIVVWSIVAWFFALAFSAKSQDLSSRVPTKILAQQQPVTVYVSVHSTTTIEFPSKIQSLEGDRFTTKPNDEDGDFYIAPGLNWVSIRSLHAGARQNLGVVMAGRVYELMIETSEQNDFSVILKFDQPAKTVASK